MSEHIADNIKAVIFDHDDTLVGTIGPKWAQHKFVAKTYYNKDLTDEELRLHWGKPFLEMICLLYGTDEPEEARSNAQAHHKDYPKELFVASIPTLKHIKAAGRLIGIVTATTDWSIKHDLDMHNVPVDLIDYIQTSENTSFHKPDPRVFEPTIEWLQTNNIKPKETLYVGDGLQDMKAAVGAGFNFLGVETGLITADQFKAAGAKSIPTIGHIVDL